MSNVKIIKGNLFNAPEESIICHAVNCRGVWGAGIALQFAKRFPWSFREYQKICASKKDWELVGTTSLISSPKHIIGCLFTSKGFGDNADPESYILYQTINAISDLISKNIHKRPIHMCKINSGLFGVKWEKTQKVLEMFPEQEFTVYEV